VIIGGGDTGADCLGVATGRAAASVTQLDIYPEPPSSRDAERDPWPTWPWVLRSYPAHEEGGVREFAVAVQEFAPSASAAGAVGAVRIAEVQVEKHDGRRVVTVKRGTERDLPADLVLLAIGFEGTDAHKLLGQLGLATRGTVDCGHDWQTTVPGVFVAGDMHRGRVADRVGDRRGARRRRGDPHLPRRGGLAAGACRTGVAALSVLR
jgi:glutamate synthase (NADPH/NADH) small chain